MVGSPQMVGSPPRGTNYLGSILMGSHRHANEVACVSWVAPGHQSYPGSQQPILGSETMACYMLYVHKAAVWLTHCGLVTPYGDVDLGQHWLR